MAVGRSTAAAESAESTASSEKGPSTVVPVSDSHSTGEDATTRQQYDVKIADGRADSTPEPPIMAPKAVPPSASPSPPVKKESRPTLLKPQYKTALRDFVVSIQSTFTLSPSKAYIIPAHLLLLNMAGQSAAPCCGHDLNWGRCYHARHEHHFWYIDTQRMPY